MIDSLAASYTWKVLHVCYASFENVWHRKTEIRYLTLPFKAKMEHFETYSTNPAVLYLLT